MVAFTEVNMKTTLRQGQCEPFVENSSLLMPAKTEATAVGYYSF